MRITILDGAEAPGPMDGWIDGLERGLGDGGHAVRRFRLREREVGQCRGCFACWTRTPGVCALRDGTEEILREALASDLLVVASPTSMGMTTALSRRGTERLVPILHPHFEVVSGEIHHRARYARHPRMALLYGPEGCDAEDAELLVELYQRLALNMRSSLAYATSTSTTPEEVCHALARA
jgi:multimeric flavodoxin WrbA